MPLARIRVTGGSGGPFAKALDAAIREWRADVGRFYRGRVKAARAELRPVVRRIYQQQLRRAAPKRSGALRRSIRVNVRNLGGDAINARVKMAFYGYIMNASDWSEHYLWASRARDLATKKIRGEAFRILQKHFGG